MTTGRLGGVLSRPATKAATAKLELISHNVKVGRAPRAVILGIHAAMGGRPPGVAVLMEASGYIKALKEAFGALYYVLHASGWAEAASTVVLVRRDLPLTRWTAMRMRTSWVGPKALLPHAPRTHLVIDIGNPKLGPAWRIVATHRVPGGPTGGVQTHGRNAPAYAEEHHRLERLADRPGSHRRALIIVGDQNAEQDDRHRLSPAGLADAIGANVVSTKAKVDWALARDCRGTSSRGGYFGSDHPAMCYTFTHARKAAA